MNSRKHSSQLAIAAALAALLGVASASAQTADQAIVTPAPNQVVYLPQLPGAGALAKAAPAQGMTIAQITQSSDQVTVVYQMANGQTNTVAYRLLSAVEGSAAAPSNPAAPVAPAYPPPAPAVVYTQPAPAYYYSPGYYAWPWYGPVAVNLGFGWGWRGGWGGGGWRGGWGGWHGR